MGGSPQSLSSQDIQDLQEISSRLPHGHPMIGKISTLLNSHGGTLADKVVDAGDGRVISFPGDMNDEKISSFITNSKPTQFERDRTGGDRGFVSGAKSALGLNSPEPSFGEKMKTSLDAGMPGHSKNTLRCGEKCP
jgi:hypothetical protein